MPRIRCLYGDCTFLDGLYCSAERIQLDPDIGCLTYRQIGDVDDTDEDLENDDLPDEDEGGWESDDDDDEP